MRVILPNRPFRMDERIDEANIAKLIARINNVPDVGKVAIKSFVRIDFYYEPLIEVEYSIFGREENLLRAS